MWPLPTISNELVTVTINPQALVCSWIQALQSTSSFVLKAYKRIPLECMENEKSILFNLTFFQHQIKNFLRTYNLNDAFILCSITGSGIVESIVEMPTSSPKLYDFHFPKLNSLVWDYRYLYPKDNACYTFYVCGINYPLLLQHQLLAITTPFNLLTITTERMALFYLYKKIYGSAFRRSQLGRDMEEHQNEIYTLFTADVIRRTLAIKPVLAISLEQEKSWLLMALALFWIGKDMYGAHKFY